MSFSHCVECVDGDPISVYAVSSCSVCTIVDGLMRFGRSYRYELRSCMEDQ